MTDEGPDEAEDEAAEPSVQPRFYYTARYQESGGKWTEFPVAWGTPLKDGSDGKPRSTFTARGRTWAVLELEKQASSIALGRGVVTVTPVPTAR
jgi:hypothetical protein